MPPTPERASETITVSSMVPTVMGSLSQRMLSQPKMAAMATRMLMISRVVIDMAAAGQACLMLADKQGCGGRGELESRAAAGQQVSELAGRRVSEERSVGSAASM